MSEEYIDQQLLPLMPDRQDQTKNNKKNSKGKIVKDVISKNKTITGSKPDDVIIDPVLENTNNNFENFILNTAAESVAMIYDQIMEDESEKMPKKINHANSHFRDDGSAARVILYKHDTPGEPKSKLVVDDINLNFESWVNDENPDPKNKEVTNRHNQNRKKIQLVPRDQKDRMEDDRPYRQQSIEKKVIEGTLYINGKPMHDPHETPSARRRALRGATRKPINGPSKALNKAIDDINKIEPPKKKNWSKMGNPPYNEDVNTIFNEAFGRSRTQGRGYKSPAQKIADAAKKMRKKDPLEGMAAAAERIKQSFNPVKNEDVAINSAGGGGIRGLGYISNGGDTDSSDPYIDANIANADTRDNIMAGHIQSHLDMHAIVDDSSTIKAGTTPVQDDDNELDKNSHASIPVRTSLSTINSNPDKSPKITKEDYETPVTTGKLASPDHYSAIKDIALNTKNRNLTIKEYSYGPMDPNDEKNNEQFWKDKADLWNTTVEAAKQARCGNCAVFNQSPKVLKMIDDAIGENGVKVQKLANLGFCEFFEFKCAAARTCDAWVMNGPLKEEVNEDLRKWFKDKWVRMDTKGNIVGDCARDEGEGKPKCLPMAKAQAMDKKDRAAAARRKRREDPVADRPGKGEAPVFVKTEAKNWAQQAAIAIAMQKAKKKPKNEEVEHLEEKNTPTNPALWTRAKALAKSKFDVYPSAYANGWAAKWYKSKGGSWKSVNEDATTEKDPIKHLEDRLNTATDKSHNGIDKIMRQVANDFNMNVQDLHNMWVKKTGNTPDQYVKEETLHEGVAYHLNNNIPFNESIFRYGSEEFFNTINEARKLFNEEKIDLTYGDIELIRTDIGTFGIYEGKEVPLDLPLTEEESDHPPLNKPRKGGPKKYYVYVRKPDGGIKKVTFGDSHGAADGSTLPSRINDPVARKSFAARHKCHLQKDRTSAAYWSCNLPRYAKSLGLSGGGNFYW